MRGRGVRYKPGYKPGSKRRAVRDRSLNRGEGWGGVTSQVLPLQKRGEVEKGPKPPIHDSF